jgi:ElaB/YqjD/DUF883 family membrane-anchored ribosome-binding protein
MSTRPTGAITDGHARVVRDPAVARAEAELAESRAEVAESMMALRDEVARRTDWRGWIRRRPGLALGAAFAVGLLLGTRGRGWRPGKETGGWSWR